jgi:hypothetical protein
MWSRDHNSYVTFEERPNYVVEWVRILFRTREIMCSIIVSQLKTLKNSMGQLSRTCGVRMRARPPPPPFPQWRQSAACTGFWEFIPDFGLTYRPKGDMETIRNRLMHILGHFPSSLNLKRLTMVLPDDGNRVSFQGVGVWKFYFILFYFFFV